MFTRANEILPVFFAAMREGYVGSPRRKSLYVGNTALAVATIDLAPIPGVKAVSFRNGDFDVLDYWFTTPLSQFSVGSTNIWCEGSLVWHMAYQGWYKDEVIPFLKEALKQTYDRSEFLGGRGPVKYTNGMLTYTNTVGRSDWRHFNGREQIVVNDTQECVGFHEYQGLLLAV